MAVFPQVNPSRERERETDSQTDRHTETEREREQIKHLTREFDFSRSYQML